MSSLSDEEFQKRHQQALADLSSLGRVEHRLALTEAHQLSKVLNLLLPRLLSRIGTNQSNQNQIIITNNNNSNSNNKKKEWVDLLQQAHQNIHQKLIRMLGHIMKRVREDPACVLPCQSILDLLLTPNKESYNTQVNSFTLNLALAFLTIGVPRSTTSSNQKSGDEQENLLPGLLVVLGHHSGIKTLWSSATKLQANQAAHLVLMVLEKHQQQTNKSVSAAATRKLLQENETASQALYDLLLDGLLYQPQPSSSSSMPPFGLSQAGHDRLRSGSNWPTNMASPKRLRDFKISILTMIAPSMRWSFFMEGKALGVSRTVALLVAASGDNHPEVSDRANLYLKAHLDSMRSAKKGQNESNNDNSKTILLGDGVALACSLLSLTLGESNAERIVKQSAITTTLGRYESNTTTTTTTVQQQTLLSLKRRKTSDKTLGAIFSFVATKILDENPHLLDTTEQARTVASLAVFSCSHVLTNMGSTTGFTTLRASPFIASTQLLNSLCVRLTANPSLWKDNGSGGNSIPQLLSKAMSTSCTVLAQASIPRPPTTMNEGSVAIRDALYGAVSNLARSKEFCRLCSNALFGRGQDGYGRTSIETVTLLFGCASNEEETLRPRAVAALDALLGAYCRIFQSPTPTKIATVTTTEVSDNPWMTAPAPISSSTTTTSNDDKSTEDRAMLSRSLLPLLWGAARSSKSKASRVAATRWGRELIKMLDLPNACHLLCFLAGDADVTASAMAREGLGLTKIGDSYQDSTPSTTLPDFQQVTQVLFMETVSSARPGFHDFSYAGKAAALRLGLVCLLNDLYGGEDDAVAMYVHALTDTLAMFSTVGGGRHSVDLLDEASVCLAGCMSTSRFARGLIVQEHTKLTLENMESLAISAASSRARRYVAEACGKIYQDRVLFPSMSSVLSDWVELCGIGRPLRACAKKLQSLQSGGAVGEIHGAAFLGSQCIQAFRLQALSSNDDSGTSECWESCASILELLGSGTMHRDEVIGNAYVHSIAIALDYTSVDAPILDKRLYGAIAKVLTQLEQATRRFSHGDHTDATRAIILAETVGVVLAASTSGAGYVSEGCGLGPARLTCVDAVFSLIGSMAYRSDGEVALKAGEALAAYSDAFSPENAVWTSSVDEWPDLYDDNLANDLPPHQQVLFTLLTRDIKASSPHKRTATAAALLAVVGRAAKLVNSNNSQLKKRAIVVELIKRLPDVQSTFITLLADPKSKQLSRESCCLGLAACQGLAEGYTRQSGGSESDMSDDTLSNALNESLLRAFGQTTNHGTSAMMETQAQNVERRRQENRESTASMSEPFGIEAEVGGAAGLGEAALGAYREMAAAAMALGRSDVLYALLILSVSHPVWFTPGSRDRYSAAALLGENTLVGSRTDTVELRDALRPHLGKLIPRLLRARHDPNKQTRDQMETLWNGLTGGGAEARQAITDNLLPTIDVLIDDAANKLWRARVGACGALSEVITGRSWSRLGGGGALLDDDEVMLKTSTEKTSAAVRLLRLWRVSMRALDDVRLTVRESGEMLGRSVRGLTIRLCDPTIAAKDTPGSLQDSLERDARSAASTSLRWLVKHGLNQPCAEATGVCVSCLVGIIDVVGPLILKPVLPDLIGSLLMAMSGLEPAALNYLQVRMAGRESASGSSYEDLERTRLQLAQRGPLAGALNKCLDMVPAVDLQTQQTIIPQLDSALRCGAGFATRAATADAVSSLASSCASAFKFPGSSSTNPTVRLLRALYYASEREHGQGSRDKMVHALGNLAALAPGQSVRSLALRACERYTGSSGSNDDPAVRRAAAAAIRAIAVRSSNQLADGGPKDIWCRRVLPIAFLGQKDKESKIASIWKEVWEEAGTATDSSITPRYGILVQEKLLSGLVMACVEALNDVSWARRVAGATALSELCDLNVLAPVGRSTEGGVAAKSNEELERAKRRAKASNLALRSCITTMMKPRIWGGKSHVVNAAIKIASKWTVVGSRSGDQTVFGWNSEGQPCPWMPILLSPITNEQNDLFLGDKYFLQQKPSEVVEEMDVERTSQGNTNELAGEVKLDFDDGDKDIANEETDEDNNPEEQSDVLTFGGMCKALISQAVPSERHSSIAQSDEVLPYRAAALKGIADLLTSLGSAANNRELQNQLQGVHKMISPVLLSIIDTNKIIAFSVPLAESQPPLIVARATDCFAASVWDNDGTMDLKQYVELFRVSGKTTGAWTVRESATLAVATLAFRGHLSGLRQHETITKLLECTEQALKDRKFWRVRHAGLKVLQSLVQRAGNTNSIISKTESSSSNQLILEALLPHKEQIVSLARTSLADPEPGVTATASEILGATAWWP